MKEQFKTKKFYAKTKINLDNILKIVAEYEQRNIILTLRQLYYQLVARGFIPNTDKSYRQTTRIVRDGRYVGLIDWDSIEDRARVTNFPGEWETMQEHLEEAIEFFRLPRWAGQDYYIELLTEKDALSSVLSGIAYKYHIHFSVNRGYDSTSAVYRLSQRILEHNKKTKIIYVGDHDPSGLDMLRDIEERIREFTRDTICFDVIPVALTIEQVGIYSPPPNPAKETDKRAPGYIERFGRNSWEVDALRPEVLTNLVTLSIQKYLDIDMVNTIIEKENEDRKQLMALLKEKGMM